MESIQGKLVTLVLLLATAACSGTTTDERLALVVAPPRGDGSGAPVDYSTMCRNYCHALEQTSFYTCVQAGGSAGACVDEVATLEDQCYELRCIPQLVQATVCVQQCDSLDAIYTPVCGASTDLDLCPTLPTVHDQACREGCALATAS